MGLEKVKEDFLIFKEIQGVSPRTIKLYDYSITGLFDYIEKIGIDDVKQVKASDIRSYISSLDNCNNTTKSIRVRVYNTLFKWLNDEKAINENPMDQVPKPKVPDRYPQVLSDDDLKKLLDTCRRQPRNFAILCLMLDTGIRVTELCDVELDDIDLERRSLIIQSGKGSKSRTVYFSPVTSRAVKRYMLQRPDDGPDDCLFLSWKTHARMDRCAVGRMIKRLGKRAGINENKRVSPHTMRHCFATMYARNGGDPHSLMCLLGHTTTRMAEKYVHMVGREIQEIHRRCSPMDKLR